MECPKCHSIIDDKQTVCPKCSKVLLLECPNCHSLEDTATCSQCGYKILIKCSKCGRINPSINDLCVKCGFPTKTSLAYQECESDDIASVVIKFNNLKKIRRLLQSKDLYEKFYFKLKNLLLAQIKNTEGLFITYGETFVVNFNKELSFPTSSNKAVRFSLKLANSFTQLNSNILEALRTPLGLNITIVKKSAEDLQELHTFENNVKLLNIKKDVKKYLKGTQIIIDQNVWDEINKDYKTDSLYSLEENGTTTTFYEIVLDPYVLPPESENDNGTINAVQYVLSKKPPKEKENVDIYSFKVFDINAKCNFDKVSAVALNEKLRTLDLNKNGKIISLRSKPELSADLCEIANFYKKHGFRTIIVNCTEEMNYKPWGFFERIFKEYYGLPALSIKNSDNINPEHRKAFGSLFDFCAGKAVKASSPEDARFNYIELWSKFLSILSKTVILVNNFDAIDDTSIQTLSLYFDRYLNVKPNFVFVTSDTVSVHSKIKSLIQTKLYTELTLVSSSFSNCLSSIKADASDFIGSFYFEKIQENFNGSYLYFKYALDYLTETGVLINFENKLLVKDSKSVVIPNDLKDLCKTRIKHFAKNSDVYCILVYLSMLDSRIDTKLLESLGVNNLKENIKVLTDAKIAYLSGNILEIYNYNLLKDCILSLANDNKEKEFVNKLLSVIENSNADITTKALLLGRIKSFEAEYLKLCDNADFAILTGDFDAYLKNCLGFLSLIESVDSNISQIDIENRKKDVYNSILLYLYSYAPDKIYFIENILLMDAINSNDDEKIVKLSNLMLQGALISSNYTDALGLLHNILSRMEHPTILVDGAVNTKFLLLSLVNIEILYNIGSFKECYETALEILSVIRMDIIDKIKPASFSTNLFVSHVMETMRLACFAKLYLMDDGLEEFFDTINNSLSTDLPEKDCILAIRDYLAGKIYNIGNIEEYSAFSKVIFLILQEISNLKDDYKKFAQNIYQAKLLSDELHQQEIKYFCDLLIAYAYSKIGITVKAEAIYHDVIKKSDKSAIFNILIIAKYFNALLLKDSNPEKALSELSNSLDLIRKNDNQAVILYVLLEKLYIKIVNEQNHSSIDPGTEQKKFEQYAESLKLLVE